MQNKIFAYILHQKLCWYFLYLILYLYLNFFGNAIIAVYIELQMSVMNGPSFSLFLFLAFVK